MISQKPQMELRFQRELQLSDQLGVRFLDACSLMGRSQNRVWCKIFCASGTVSEVMRFTYKRNEIGSQKGPKVVISSENVTPSRYFLKMLRTHTQRRNADSALGPATAHTPHTLQTLMANKKYSLLTSRSGALRLPPLSNKRVE